MYMARLILELIPSRSAFAVNASVPATAIIVDFRFRLALHWLQVPLFSVLNMPRAPPIGVIRAAFTTTIQYPDSIRAIIPRNHRISKILLLAPISAYIITELLSIFGAAVPE